MMLEVQNAFQFIAKILSRKIHFTVSYCMQFNHNIHVKLQLIDHFNDGLK